MDARWYARTVRAALFAAVCVLLVAVGHIVMSGCAVPWWALLAGGLATGAASWAVAGRERGLPVIVTLVVGAQTMLHWGFSLAQAAVAPPAGDPGVAPADSMGHDMSSMDMGSMNAPLDVSGMDMSGLPAHSMFTQMHLAMGHSAHLGTKAEDGPGRWLMAGMPSLGMAAAHLAAAVLCGLWLGYGEHVAYRLLRAVAGWLAAPLRLVLVLPALARRPRRLVRRTHPRPAPYRLRLVHAITTRGPPSRAAVL
ncbi:hypothetical protein [Streptomyces sp. NPDC088789]|uniref:hypothetical protein n=1 Tax=Streptomyces sp. NPDC088789 TaxID=3365899 RepID=UPI0037F8BA2D